MSWTDLQIKGEQIMLSVVPTSAATNLFVNLAEPISDGMVFGLPGRALLDGNPGGEYLNTVFGILPTKQAIDDFNKATETYQKAIKQYRRDADKIVRRRAGPYKLPEVIETVLINTPLVTPKGGSLSPLLMGPSPNCVRTKRINREVWYAGAFQYHIPKDLSSFENQILDWQRAYHILPSPSDIWELLPFSWLADWFTNGGNSLRHLFLQSSEGATQRYGYVMCKSTVETSWNWTGSVMVNNILQPYTTTAVVSKTIKQRSRVSPFGVHFTGVDFSPRQLAILAALGISK
jgi:tetratricopeptide (TPR) repeat protein